MGVGGDGPWLAQVGRPRWAGRGWQATMAGRGGRGGGENGGAWDSGRRGLLKASIRAGKTLHLPWTRQPHALQAVRPSSRFSSRSSRPARTVETSDTQRLAVRYPGRPESRAPPSAPPRPPRPGPSSATDRPATGAVPTLDRATSTALDPGHGRATGHPGRRPPPRYRPFSFTRGQLLGSKPHRRGRVAFRLPTWGI